VFALSSDEICSSHSASVDPAATVAMCGKVELESDVEDACF
jgi:hypothetical protein